MLTVCYSLHEAIDISGLPNEIEEFRQKVLGLLKTNLERIQIEIDKTVNSNPWDFAAEGLEVIQNGEAVRVSVSTDRIVKIKGSKENLEKFTSFLEFEESDASGTHRHYEHYEGNECITADSIPLIIEIK